MWGVCTSKSEGVDVLAVVTARHELLAKTNGVFALGYIVKHLELLLGDALGKLAIIRRR